MNRILIVVLCLCVCAFAEQNADSAEKSQKEPMQQVPVLKVDANSTKPKGMSEDAAKRWEAHRKHRANVRKMVDERKEKYQDQVEDIIAKVTKEENKHRQRLAKLNRIRSLLKDDPKVLERVDTLIEREKTRHGKKLIRLRGKQQQIGQYLQSLEPGNKTDNAAEK